MACPSDRQIASLIEGRLSPPELTSLHEHVATCLACGELVTHLVRAGGDEAERPSAGGSSSEYVLADRLGRGGMGVVYRATDAQLGRTVALKFLAQSALESRFLREALITARLQHPSIVPIYQSGRWPSGEVFYAMKLISGRSLGELLAAAPSLRERLALLPRLLAAADAVAYAHEQRIIHRDLKPANIMAGPFGETVVIDWGLAKDLAAADEPAQDEAAAAATATSGEALTRAGSVMGTPEYIAPEQARGEPVDERADVFALGAILHHLLTGAPPRRGATASQLLADAARAAPAATVAHEPDAPRDLVAIVDKAMASAAPARYPSARELADDLRRFQTGQLVAAQAYSLGALLSRWLKRHRLVVAVTLVLLVVLAASQALSLRRIVRERALAVQGRDALILEQAVAQLDRDPTATLSWLKQYPASGSEAARVSDVAIEAAARGVAQHVFRVGHAGGARGDFSPDGRLFAGRGGDDIRVWETATGKTIAARPAPRNSLVIRFSPDGKRLAFVGMAELATPVYVWDFAGGAMQTLDGPGGRDDTIAWAPDSRHLAAAGWDGVVRVWDLADLHLQQWRGHTKPVLRLEYSRDGQQLLSATDNSLWLWTVAIGAGKEILRDERLGPLFAVADESSRAVALGDDAIHLFDLASGSHRAFPMPDEKTRAVAIAADGAWAVLGATDGSVRRLRLDDGQLTTLGSQPHEVSVVAVAPDRSRVATGGLDGVVRLWDPGTGEARELRAAVDGAVKDIVFARDSRQLATWTDYYTERLWRLPAVAPLTVRGHDNVVHQVVFAPDSSAVATASSDETVYVQRLADASGRTLHGHRDHVMRIAYSPDGKRLASSSFDGTVRVWDVAAGTSRLLRGHQGPILSLVFSRDGTAVITGSLDGSIRVWDVAGGDSRLLDGHRGPVAYLALSPDGARLASGGDDGTVRLWDWRAGTSRIVFTHDSDVRGLDLSPDGKWIVSGDGAGAIHLGDVAGGQACSWRQQNEVLLPTFSPTEPLLATIDGQVIRLWQLDGTPVKVLEGHKTSIWRLAFSPDGKLVASGGFDGVVRVWDCPAGRLRAVERSGGRISWVTFSPDGRFVAASSFASTARLWPVDALPRLPATEGATATWLDGFTSARLDEERQPTTP